MSGSLAAASTKSLIIWGRWAKIIVFKEYFRSYQSRVNSENSAGIRRYHVIVRQNSVRPESLQDSAILLKLLYFTRHKGSRGRVVSASDSGSGGRGFDSRPSHVVIALGKQFTLTFPSPPTCKTGTQLQAMSLWYAPATSCIWVKKWLSNVLVCWGISGAALWRHSYAE